MTIFALYNCITVIYSVTCPSESLCFSSPTGHERSAARTVNRETSGLSLCCWLKTDVMQCPSKWQKQVCVCYRHSFHVKSGCIITQDAAPHFPWEKTEYGKRDLVMTERSHGCCQIVHTTHIYKHEIPSLLHAESKPLYLLFINVFLFSSAYTMISFI